MAIYQGKIAIRVGLPVTTAGATINRFCSSGMQAITMAAQRIMSNELDICVAGGLQLVSFKMNIKITLWHKKIGLIKINLNYIIL